MSTQAAKIACVKATCFYSWPSVFPLLGLLVLTVLCSISQSTRAAGPPFTDANWISLPGATNLIRAAVVDTNGNLFVGGYFTNIGGINANYVAEWNGTTWMPLGSGMDYDVFTLVFDASGNLYAGGEFTNAGGTQASEIAKWDGTNWTSLGSGVNGGDGMNFSEVDALCTDSAGNVYVGGNFASAGSVPAVNIAKWNGSAWSALSLGVNNTVFAVACDRLGRLCAGGQFTIAGGKRAAGIAEWDGTNWFALGSGAASPVSAVCFDSSGILYAAPGPGLGAEPTFMIWDGTNWSTPSYQYADILCLVFRSSLLFGGGFKSVIQWNGTNLSPLGSGINGTVYSIAFDSVGNIYVVGQFSAAGTNPAANIAKALLFGPLPNQLTIDQSVSGTNRISYLGTPGNSYALDLATDLTPPIDWIPQTTNIASTNNATAAGYVTFSNSVVPPQGFYRVRSVP